MSDCIFCKIIKGEIPSKKVYEDDKVYAFYDIDAKAPVHVLIVPKVHIPSVNELNENNVSVLPYVMLAAKKIAKDLNVDKGGYRIVINTGKDAGQTVPHIHFHMLGGRDLAWPPG
ncbi:MAG: histidine triad nucleotide-binding protein [Eubacteriales bacterium]